MFNFQETSKVKFSFVVFFSSRVSGSTGFRGGLERSQSFPGGSDGKECGCNAEPGWISGWGQSPGEGNGNPL